MIPANEPMFASLHDLADDPVGGGRGDSTVLSDGDDDQYDGSDRHRDAGRYCGEQLDYPSRPYQPVETIRHGADGCHRESGQQRIRPILMTTLTTILALLPMTFGFGEGASLRSPMAIAVIGGLVTSTVMSLMVIPCVYYVFEKMKRGK